MSEAVKRQTPGTPSGPAGPTAPRAPCRPAGPVSPVPPFSPSGPVSPLPPGEPVAPGAPAAPGSPGSPGPPAAPCAPMAPIGGAGPKATWRLTVSLSRLALRSAPLLAVSVNSRVSAGPSSRSPKLGPRAPAVVEKKTGDPGSVRGENALPSLSVSRLAVNSPDPLGRGTIRAGPSSVSTRRGAVRTTARGPATTWLQVKSPGPLLQPHQLSRASTMPE